MTSLSQRVAELEGVLERGERDRNSLNSQLEEAYKKLTAQETDSSKVLPSENRPHNNQSLLIWTVLFLMLFRQDEVQMILCWSHLIPQVFLNQVNERNLKLVY